MRYTRHQEHTLEYSSEVICGHNGWVPSVHTKVHELTPQKPSGRNQIQPQSLLWQPLLICLLNSSAKLANQNCEFRNSRTFVCLEIMQNRTQICIITICQFWNWIIPIGVQRAGWLDIDSHESWRHRTEHNRSFYHTWWCNTDWPTDQMITEWMTFSLLGDTSVCW
jgi:hypothetical protein